MKGPMNVLRSVASSSRAVSKRPLRGFASSTTRAEGVQASAGSERSFQVSSSISASGPESEVASEAYMEDTPEEVFRRNLRDLQAFRRRKDTEKKQAKLFLPSGSSAPPKPSPMKTSLSTLMASGAALGHSSSLLNPAYTPYVYGNRSGLSIIDLDQTLPILRRTAALVRDVVKEDGTVLIISTRDGLDKCMHKAKERLGDNGFITNQWMPGTLTNAQTYFGLDAMEDKAHLPALVILLNPSECLGAIKECTTMRIPTIGIVDTDTDPRIVTYPIPANMESIRTTELILGTLSIAGQEGRRLRLKEAEAEARAQQRLRN